MNERILDKSITPHYLEVYVSANSKSNDEKSKAEEKQRNCATVQLSLLARHFFKITSKMMLIFYLQITNRCLFPS